MILTRNELRFIIKEAVEQQQTDKMMDGLDSVVDKAAESGEDFLDKLADHALKAGKKAKEENPEPEGPTDEVGLVAGGWIVAGTAAAMPIIMKGIGHLAKLIAKGMDKIDNKFGGDAYDYEKLGEDWQDWWNGKSEDLHHKYINGCRKLVDVYCFLRGVDPSEESRQKCAKLIWTMVIAFLMYKSGAGLLHSVHAHTYGVAGLEGVLAAIKGGEIVAYAHEAFAGVLGAAAVLMA